MNKILCLVAVLGTSACTHSPIAPSMSEPLVLGLAGQSNSILMRPFLSQVATVVGAGDQVTTIDCWSANGECWHELEPTLHTRLDAFVWWQGESDVMMLTPEASYRAQMADLMRRVRLAANNQRLLIVVMQYGLQWVGTPDQAPRAWVLSDRDAVYVETRDLEFRWWDPAHMTESGYAAVSERIASIVHTRLR